jgi:hypothetical protein
MSNQTTRKRLLSSLAIAATLSTSSFYFAPRPALSSSFYDQQMEYRRRDIQQIDRQFSIGAQDARDAAREREERRENKGFQWWYIPAGIFFLACFGGK